MIDRFGPLPEPVIGLLESMRLKWLAKEIGFEKLVLKSGKMLGYFIVDQESPYYQTEMFGKVLEFMKNPNNNCQIKDRNGKLFLSFKDVESIGQASSICNRILR
jgi:transcription-repair coupling factor (superfamily II helicase)